MRQELRKNGRRSGARWAVVAVLVWTHGTWAQVPAQRQPLQKQFGFLRRDVSQEVGGYLILPQPPRQLRRALTEAERAIAERQYSEAVDALREILDGPSNEDYFLPREDQPGGAISLKKRARTLLGSLPRAGREIYELQVGSEARRLLNEALEQSDIDGLMEVSRRFFHSEVGYQATMLLGRYELDQGRPLAAALHLDRLRKAPAAGTKFEPELSLLLAVCWQLAGQEEAAREVLVERQSLLAGTNYAVAGEELTLPADEESLQTWMKDSLHASVSRKTTETQSWPLFRGDSHRNPAVAGGMPLAKLEWANETALLPNDEAEIVALHRSMQDNETPAIPAMQPLAVGDQLLMRTARIMLGVDLRTGLRVWPYPEEELERGEGRRLPSATNLRQRKVSEQNRSLLAQRIWQDAPYAQMSSDGQRLFLLRDLSPANSQFATPEIIMFGRQARIQNGLSLPKDYNRLVALELATQGKTLWSVGGPDSHEPQLTSAFFLGAPLPLDGHVYALAEIKDEIKLLSLDSATGQLEWSQQLAQIEAPYTVHADSIRRLAGATPSFSEGVLVCPTSSGAVVAVELASRSLLWGHRYQRDSSPKSKLERRAVFGTRLGLPSMNLPGNHWCDAVAVIEQGHVLLTPLESNRLHCLDLLTGKSLWPPVRRDDMLFIGAVHEGIILMVHKSRLRGLDLRSGKSAWPPILLEDGEFPSGRGFLSDGAYYLPTSKSEILKVDVREGQILERQPTERVLGNLICHGDYLISQGPDGVFAYCIRERKRASVMQQMAQTPDDPELLEDYANLLASDGDTMEAMKVLRRAIELQPDETRKVALRESLVRLVISALREDFMAYRQLADEARQLAPTPRLQRELAWIIADGLAEHADPVAAFAAYLELVNQLPVWPSDSPPVIRKRATQGEGAWRVAVEMDLALKIEGLLAKADDAAAERMQSTLSDYVDAAIKSQDPERLRELLTISHGQPVANKLRRNLAELLIGQERWLEAELMLNRLPDTELREALRARIVSATSAAAPERHVWPDGHIVTSESTDARPEVRQWFAIELRSASHGWPAGRQLAIDSPNRRLVVTDAYGRVLARIPLQDYDRMAYRAAHARAYGHLLIVSLGSHLLAVDMLRTTHRDDERVLWQIAIDNTDSPLGNDLFGRAQRPRPQPRNIPFDSSRYVMVDANGSPYGQVGPVSDEGVCLIKSGDLHCLDPLTGEVKWIQRDIKSRTTLFGDDQYVFACHTITGETRVFQIRDGRQVSQVKAPQGSRHWRTHGRHIIYYDGSYNTGRDLQVRLYDPWEERDVWTWSLAAKSKGCFVGHDELALMQPDGKLVVLRLEDGQLILQADLEPEDNLMPIEVFRSSDQYLIVTNRDDGARISQLRRANIQLQVPSSGIYPTTRITGRIYALDRQTGQPLWRHPVQVEQYWLLRPVPAELPVLVMLRQVRRQQKRPQDKGLIRTTSTSVVAVDRRTGRIAMERLDISTGTSFCSIEGDPLTDQIELRLPPEKTFVLQLTDQPGEASEAPARLGPVEIAPPANK